MLQKLRPQPIYVHRRPIVSGNDDYTGDGHSLELGTVLAYLVYCSTQTPIRLVQRPLPAPSCMTPRACCYKIRQLFEELDG